MQMLRVNGATYKVQTVQSCATLLLAVLEYHRTTVPGLHLHRLLAWCGCADDLQATLRAAGDTDRCSRRFASRANFRAACGGRRRPPAAGSAVAAAGFFSGCGGSPYAGTDASHLHPENIPETSRDVVPLASRDASQYNGLYRATEHPGMFVPRSIPSSIPPASREASSRAGCYFKPGSSPERTVLSGPWSLLKGPQNGHRTAAASESTTGSGAGKMNHAELSVMETLDRLGCAATRSRWKNDVRPVLRRIKNGPVQGQPRPLQSIVCCKCSSGDRNMAHHCLCPNKTASKKEEKEIYASVLQQIKTMIDRDPQWGASRAMIRHGSAVQTLAQINQSRCTAPLLHNYLRTCRPTQLPGVDLALMSLPVRTGMLLYKQLQVRYLTCVMVYN